MRRKRGLGEGRIGKGILADRGNGRGDVHLAKRIRARADVARNGGEPLRKRQPFERFEPGEGALGQRRRTRYDVFLKRTGHFRDVSFADAELIAMRPLRRLLRGPSDERQRQLLESRATVERTDADFTDAVRHDDFRQVRTRVERISVYADDGEHVGRSRIDLDRHLPRHDDAPGRRARHGSLMVANNVQLKDVEVGIAEGRDAIAGPEHPPDARRRIRPATFVQDAVAVGGIAIASLESTRRTPSDRPPA